MDIKLKQELFEILMLDDGEKEDESILIDSMTALLLAEFFKSNFNYALTKEEIENFEKFNDIRKLVEKLK